MISKRYKNDLKPLLSLNRLQLKTKREIEEKIAEGFYLFEDINCPICESSVTFSLAEKDRYGLYYSVKICTNCGLVFTSPRMTQASYNEFYQKDYRKLYLGTESPTENYSNKLYQRGRTILSYIQDNLSLDFNDITVLEIGCSSGGILLAFKEKGCKVLGVDLDRKYVEFGRKNYGLNLIHGSLKDVPEDFVPDIIIYSHVLEHILDLDQELNTISRISSENAFLYIEVPGIKNIHSQYQYDLLKYLQNAHTFHFSLTTLKNILEKHQFELISGNEEIKSIYRKGPRGSLGKPRANDFQNVQDYLKVVEKQRKINNFKIEALINRTKFIASRMVLKILTVLHIKKIVKRILY